MRKILTIICILVLAVAFTAPAWAAVQNVKVSGDLTVRGMGRWNDDLNTKDSNTALRNWGANPFPIHWMMRFNEDLFGPNAFNINAQGNAATDTSNGETFIMSTARLRVDADLTDNVSVAISLANQRDWTHNSNTNLDVGINLAYVTLKEMLYAPLTVTIGRQELWFGKGFVVGSNLLTLGDPEGSISAEEYGVFSPSFDAVRANLNYDPVTIDLVYSRITEGIENNPSQQAAGDLYGINAGYKFNQYNAEVEAYYWLFQDNRYRYTDPADIYNNGGNYMTSQVGANFTARVPRGTAPTEEIHTIGGRGSLDPIPNLTIAGEIAGQLGTSWAVEGTTRSYETRERRALAGDISGEYRFTNMTWSPKIGAEYIYYSGEKSPTGNNDPVNCDSDSTDNAWNPMFRGKFDTAIREFQGGALHGKAILAGLYMIDDIRNTPGFTNEHQVAVFGAIKPMKDLKLDGRFTFFWTAEDVKYTNYFTGATMERDSHIGNELDMQLSYNYTEDVTFGLLGAWFFPGDFFKAGHGGRTSDDFAPNQQWGLVRPRTGDTGDRADGDPFNRTGDNMAAEVVGSVSVVF